MIEIYADIPERVRKQAKFIFDIATVKLDATRAIKILNNYLNTITDEYEREFVMFYFDTRIKELLNK